MELDPIYVDVAVRRWQSFTGQAATREADMADTGASQAGSPSSIG